MYFIKDIASENYKQYANFVFPSQRSILRTADGEKVVAAGIMSDETPVGAALACRLDAAGMKWRLLSVYITPAHRHKGAGKILLQAIEKLMAQKGCEMVHASYVMPLYKACGINEFLTVHGWVRPDLKARIYRWDSSVKECRFSASVIKYGRTPMAEGFKILPFHDINDEEKNRIKQEMGHRYPAHLSPLINEEFADPVCSLALYSGEKLAGWIVALRVSPGALLYRSIFVFKEFRGTMAGIYLLQEAVRRHIEHYPSFEAICSVEETNKLMDGVVKRFFEGSHKSLSYEYGSSKNLGGVTAGSEMWSEYVQSADNLESTRKFILNHDMAPLVVNYIGIQEGMKVLDAGCGTGAFTRYLARAAPKAQYTGIDIDSSLVAAAQRLAGGVPEGTDIRFIKGNVLAMPFEDESFDIIASHTLTDNVPDTETLFSEMLRVVKKGGRIAAVSSMSYGHQAMWDGDYPPECLFQKRYLELNEKMYRGYMNLCPVGGYLRGIPAVKLPRFFSVKGLKCISAYPIGRLFSLSNHAMTDDNKREYIEMWYRSEREKLEVYRRLPGFDMYAVQEECEEYLEVLKEKADYLGRNISENEIWEWNGGGNLLVVGTKLSGEKEIPS